MFFTQRSINPPNSDFYIRPNLFTGIENAEKIVQKLSERESLSIFQESGIDPKKDIYDPETGTPLQTPNPLPDRKALDDIVFDAIGLTKEERDEVYRAVCQLVKNRLEKARSLKG